MKGLHNMTREAMNLLVALVTVVLPLNSGFEQAASRLNLHHLLGRDLSENDI